MICIPYYNSYTCAMFTHKRWEEILSHPVETCVVERCSLCSSLTMIKSTASDVPLPPIGSSKEVIERFANGAMILSQGKRISCLTAKECIKQDEKNDSIVDYYGVSSLK